MTRPEGTRPGAVRRAELDDLDALTSLTVKSCHPTALAAWLVADPAQRYRVLHEHISVVLLHALRLGQVWTIDRHAVAVWSPHPTTPVADDGDPQPWPDPARGSHVDRFQVLSEALDRRCPTDPHQHLTLLAVAAARQRQGLAARLLDHHLAHLDTTGDVVAVTTCGVDGRRQVLRRAFRDHGPPIDLPDGPRLWPMLRHPAPHALEKFS